MYGLPEGVVIAVPPGAFVSDAVSVRLSNTTREVRGIFSDAMAYSSSQIGQCLPIPLPPENRGLNPKRRFQLAVKPACRRSASRTRAQTKPATTPGSLRDAPP